MCACSSIKQYVQPSYGCRGTPVVAGMFILRNFFYLIHNVIKKILEQERNFFSQSRDAAVKKNRYKRE